MVWGLSAFRLLSHLQLLCAKLSSGPALHPQQRLELDPCVLEGGDLWSKRQGLGTKASPSNLSKGRTSLDCRYHHTLGTNQGTEG